MRTGLIIVLSIGFFAVSSFAQNATPTKKLIEFGWDEPDTAYMRQHIASMELSPFDGCVYHLPGDYLWQTWGKRTFTDAELAGALDDLKNTPFKRFTHNFLRFNVTPGDVDWFDDFAPILANAKLAAKIAREGKSAGILFDVEQYSGQPFVYRKQRDAATKSFDQYADQARLRGEEVMRAMQDGFPDLVIILTFGYSLPYTQTGGDKAKLPDSDYGLLLPFLDGMYAAANGKTRIVDGYELSYSFKDAKQFDDAAKLMRESLLPLIADPAKYKSHGGIGFGLWMDYDWRKFGWHTADSSKNYFSPAQFQASVSKAIATADEYVWIYTETPRWWSKTDGKPEELPTAYDHAVRTAIGK